MMARRKQFGIRHSLPAHTTRGDNNQRGSADKADNLLNETNQHERPPQPFARPCADDVTRETQTPAAAAVDVIARSSCANVVRRVSGMVCRHIAAVNCAGKRCGECVI